MHGIRFVGSKQGQERSYKHDGVSYPLDVQSAESDDLLSCGTMIISFVVSSNFSRHSLIATIIYVRMRLTAPNTKLKKQYKPSLVFYFWSPISSFVFCRGPFFCPCVSLISMYDMEGLGYLKGEDLESYIFDHIMIFEEMEGMPPSFYTFYVLTAVRRFLFFLDPKQTGWIMWGLDCME